MGAHMDKKISKQYTAAKAIKFINKIEEQFCVDMWKIDNIEIWPILRSNIFNYLLNNNNQVDIKRKNVIGKNFINNIISKVLLIMRHLYIYAKIILIDKKHNIESDNEYNILISSSNVDRTLKVKGNLLFDVNCDPFYDIFTKEYNKKILIFEYFSLDNQNLPRYSKSFCFNIIILKALIYSKFYLLKSHDIQMPEYDKFLIYTNNYGIKNIVSENEILKNIVFYDFLSNYLVEKLKKYNVKLVLMMCYYSAQNFALSLACNKLNIPCIDIQHGCAGGSLHEMYYSWLNIPEDGYKLQPSGFWCWDQEDVNAINRWKYKKKKPDIIYGGRLIRKQWIDRTGILYDYYFGKLNNQIKFAKSNFSKIILITLQPGITYPQWLKDIMLKQTDFIWIIRTHFIIDTFQTNFISNFSDNNNIIITKSQDYPLEILLSVIDVNITSYSSVIIDAEYFSKPSIMLDKSRCSMYKKYFDLGCLEYAEDVDELLVKIEKLTSRKYIRKQDDEDIYDQGINQLLGLMKKRENNEQQTKIH